MTSQRKIFGAILTLAVSALAVDHWWLGSGAQETAAPIASAMHDAPPAKAARASAAHHGGATPAHGDRTLAARLRDFARAEQTGIEGAGAADVIPDAFKPSSLWYPSQAAAPAAAPSRPAVPPERIEEFKARHRLTAVMKSARGGIAIIGGKVYVPGQIISDGFTLISIDSRGAVVSCDGASLTLPIEQPGALTSLSDLQ